MTAKNLAMAAKDLAMAHKNLEMAAKIICTIIDKKRPPCATTWTSVCCGCLPWLGISQSPV